MSDRIPVYYINLVSRTDRRDFMESQFARLGIPAERIEAVLRDQIPAEAITMARRPDGTLPIGLEEMACTLSHFAAWQRAIDAGADACAVFEDDGVIARELPRFLLELGPTLPSGVDLLKLETFQQPVRLGRKALVLGDFEARRLTSTHFGACGYVIARNLAQELISTMPLVPLPIDDYIFALHGHLLRTRGIYQSMPAFAVQLQLVHHSSTDTADLARSDLDAARIDKHRHRPYVRPPRLQRMRQNLTRAWRELKAFGLDALSPRTVVPFAEDIDARS